MTVVDDETGEIIEELLLPFETSIDRDTSSNDQQAVPSPIDPVSPIGYAALCSGCQKSRDLISFYESGRVFMVCRKCRLHDCASACAPDQIVTRETGVGGEESDSKPAYNVKYVCPCGSSLKMEGRKQHEETKKHKQWRKANASA